MKIRIVGQENSYEYQKLANGLVSNGIEIVDDTSFDFILPMYDTLSQQCADIAATAGRPFPDTAFNNKVLLEQKCVSSGIATLPSFELAIPALSACTFSNFIIKPVASTGGKHPLPWVYKIFTNEQIPEVMLMIRDTLPEYLADFFVQKALIDRETRLTYLLFVDGAVNGNGEVHFNPIAEKWMLDPTELDSHITHKAGIRLPLPDDKFNFKSKVSKLISDNGVRNTLFKAQAIVDVSAGDCYINDWSWTIMPYTHIHVLDISYVVDHLKFAYDVIPSVTKPIERTIVMHHIAFPTEDYALSQPLFDDKYLAFSQALNVVRAERVIKNSMVKPTSTPYFVLYGTQCDDVESGKSALTQFQTTVNQIYKEVL